LAVWRHQPPSSAAVGGRLATSASRGQSFSSSRCLARLARSGDRDRRARLDLVRSLPGSGAGRPGSASPRTGWGAERSFLRGPGTVRGFSSAKGVGSLGFGEAAYPMLRKEPTDDQWKGGTRTSQTSVAKRWGKRLVAPYFGYEGFPVRCASRLAGERLGDLPHGPSKPGNGLRRPQYVQRDDPCSRKTSRPAIGQPRVMKVRIRVRHLVMTLGRSERETDGRWVVRC
jgi:hypothetical protein